MAGFTPPRPPSIRFLFVGSGFRLQLPSDPTSRWAPLPRQAYSSGMVLGMVPSMHPLMKSGRMGSPGAFALNCPPMIAMGFFMLHMLFGILVGALYTAFAR